MVGAAGRKSRSLPRGPVGRPRGALANGEGHLPRLDGMMVSCSQTPRQVGLDMASLRYLVRRDQSDHASAETKIGYLMSKKEVKSHTLNRL